MAVMVPASPESAVSSAAHLLVKPEWCQSAPGCGHLSGAAAGTPVRAPGMPGRAAARPGGMGPRLVGQQLRREHIQLADRFSLAL